MSAPVWERFSEFIAPEADRFTILDEIIVKIGLKYSVIPVAGNRHFIIKPQLNENQNRSKRTVLTAHYDRSPGSPGANDNSAAVFILLETAVKLIEEKTDNWMVIFTDKEELGEGEGIKDQGAYTLAAAMKDNGTENTRIFNFDACGTGDTLIISTTVDYLLKNENNPINEKIRANIKELQQNALEAARVLNKVKVLLAPTPFSDDAGLLMAGLAAQTITMLPSDECRTLVSELRKDPDLAGALVNLESRNVRDRRTIPETWRILNSPGDGYIRLTPRNFMIGSRFILSQCR